MSKHIKNDSAQYLKSWLGSLKQGPEFLKTILGDVKRSSNMINQRLESIQQEMAKGEEANYSQFRPAALSAQMVKPEAQMQAAKEVDQVVEEEEEIHHYGRSR